MTILDKVYEKLAKTNPKLSKELVETIVATYEKVKQGSPCPFSYDSTYDFPPDFDVHTPCPVCGMLGTPDAEDLCIG